MIKKEIHTLLRSPENLKVLNSSDGNGFKTDDNEYYPVMVDGIVCLLKKDERQSALEHDNFYDSNPFGERDWSDASDVESGVENRLKDLLAQYSKTALIIDVGAGTGRISNYLSCYGFENVVSLDYSLASLRQVKINSNNICIWGNNLHLPFTSNSFDLVISSGVIHHTPDPFKSLEECLRILKPGGRLYLKTYNLNSLYCCLYYTYGTVLRIFESTKSSRILSDLCGFRVYKLVRNVFFSLPRREDRILKAKFANLFLKKMVYFFTKSEIESLLRKNGLIIESAKREKLTHRMHCYVATKRA